MILLNNSPSPRTIGLVSIITPVYNRAGYLDDVIKSVLTQDYPNIEYIILDDGSTDSSLDVMRKYEGKIKYDSHHNMGETRTVNKGFLMSRGDIIGVVNSDDPLLPGAIRRIVEKFENEKDAVVVYPDWMMIDSVGDVLEVIQTRDYNFLDMVRTHHCVPGPGAFFRRRVVEGLGGRDPSFRYVADFDFWLRAGLLGPFVRLQEVLATFRFHRDSASVREKGRAMAEEHLHLIEKFYASNHLPMGVIRVKREAYSSAYYIAGCVVGENAIPDRKKYFKMALRLAPIKYLTKYRSRLAIMLLVFFPRLFSVLQKAKKALSWQ